MTAKWSEIRRRKGAPVAKLPPIVPRYICSECGRRHSTRTRIGEAHLQHARPPKGGRA